MYDEMGAMLREEAFYLTPPAEKEEKPVAYCDLCNEPLYDGDSVVMIGGDYICEDCIEKSKITLWRE